MSYDIYIGNAELESDWPGEDNWPCARWTVRGHAEADAPSFPFDGMTENGNSRHPGYSQWGEFCRETGLHDVFFHEGEGLMRKHPGCFPLLPNHLAIVRQARQRWQERHPNTTPGWDFQPGWMRPEKDDGVRGRDPNLARLLWLEWWMDWVLRTCERPAVSNS